MQCYRGLEMIAGTDQLVFSAVDIDITVSVATLCVFCVSVVVVGGGFGIVLAGRAPQQ